MCALLKFLTLSYEEEIDSQEVLPKSLLTSCQSDLGEKITPSCKGVWEVFSLGIFFFKQVGVLLLSKKGKIRY